MCLSRCVTTFALLKATICGGRKNEEICNLLHKQQQNRPVNERDHHLKREVVFFQKYVFYFQQASSKLKMQCKEM